MSGKTGCWEGGTQQAGMEQLSLVRFLVTDGLLCAWLHLGTPLAAVTDGSPGPWVRPGASPQKQSWHLPETVWDTSTPRLPPDLLRTPLPSWTGRALASCKGHRGMEEGHREVQSLREAGWSHL